MGKCEQFLKIAEKWWGFSQAQQWEESKSKRIVADVSLVSYSVFTLQYSSHQCPFTPLRRLRTRRAGIFNSTVRCSYVSSSTLRSYTVKE